MVAVGSSDRTALHHRTLCVSGGPAWRQPVELSSRHWESRFFKSSLSCNVAFGMEWTRHQFAPAMPVQKIVDGAVAGRMPNRLFIGCLEVVDVQHLARTGSLGKARQQSLFTGQRHVLALTAADRFRLQRLDPAAVIGHMGAVHGTQRNTHRLRDRGLGHSALAQQYHLNTLPLSLRHFPMQGRLQLPNLAFRAFYHPSPPKQMARWNHKISLPSGTKLPQTPRFNQLWKRYQTMKTLLFMLSDFYDEEMAEREEDDFECRCDAPDVEPLGG